MSTPSQEERIDQLELEIQLLRNGANEADRLRRATQNRLDDAERVLARWGRGELDAENAVLAVSRALTGKSDPRPSAAESAAFARSKE